MDEESYNTRESMHRDVVSNDAAGRTTVPGERPRLFSEVLYSASSFQAMITPVSVTMVLSALAVAHVNTDETLIQGEVAFSQSYQVFDLEDGNTAQNLLASIANVLVIISVLCCLTFLVVILYKYGCTKIFNAYMIIVTTMVLGYFTTNFVTIFIKKFGLVLDKISFAYLMWNYVVVGVLAIFVNHGIPKLITQGYLVTSSVVLSWQLSYFGEWTAWTLLVFLALYDLFAVLSPCGPLKALAKLMSKPGAQPLPGLLYEASLPSGVSRPGATGRETSSRPKRQSTNSQARNSDSQIGLPNFASGGIEIVAGQQGTFSSHQPHESSPIKSESKPDAGTHNDSSPPKPRVRQEPHDMCSDDVHPTERSGQVALAIAKLYKLRVVDERNALLDESTTAPITIREYSPEEIREISWTPEQLRTEVKAIFPSRGGRIVRVPNPFSMEGARYEVYDRHSKLLRTFIVNLQGEVFQVHIPKPKEQQENTIKLGLGDFIFYAVLVSKAAQHSFPAFAGCLVCILSGLGATLSLLALHGKALPALPLSIILAVVWFLLCRFLTEPYIHDLLTLPFYV